MLKIDERKILTDERKSDITKSWAFFVAQELIKNIILLSCEIKVNKKSNT